MHYYKRISVHWSKLEMTLALKLYCDVQIRYTVSLNVRMKPVYPTPGNT